MDTDQKSKMKTEYPKRTKCEVYSRIVGYLRPVGQWHDGKKAELRDRKNFKLSCLSKPSQD